MGPVIERFHCIIVTISLFLVDEKENYVQMSFYGIQQLNSLLRLIKVNNKIKI